jgi:hypothetical protein
MGQRVSATKAYVNMLNQSGRKSLLFRAQFPHQNRFIFYHDTNHITVGLGYNVIVRTE